MYYFFLQSIKYEHECIMEKSLLGLDDYTIFIFGKQAFFGLLGQSDMSQNYVYFMFSKLFISFHFFKEQIFCHLTSGRL